MALTQAFQTKAFRIKSPCGREYHVPVTEVAKNYADHMVKTRKLQRPDIEAEMNEADVKTWFYEQFSWKEVDRYGTLVKNATSQDTERALNTVRNGLRPGTASMSRLVTMK